MDIENEIRRTILLDVAQNLVWDAIADAKKFGAWFKCTVEGDFVQGAVVNCRSLYEGNEELVWQKRIVAIEPERYFAFEWSPGETGADLYAAETGTTRVEFILSRQGDHTQLEIVESGFADLPADFSHQSFRLNSEGWDAQVANIAVYFE